MRAASRGRRILLLLTAWLSFDLATPLPGAFEFEVQDSEIEESIVVRRELRDRRTTASPRATPRPRVEHARPARAVAPPAPSAHRPTGDGWLPQVRSAHLPSAGHAPSSEDH
ncbi:MAG TPA: hypothetical protein VET45_18905 [Candidatus Binatia bacterium]|nr:hypothetical protein [Candidatus Binatia bacterium]